MIIQKFPKHIVKYSEQYERALGNLFIMLSPIAPLFASECWSKFVSVPNRIDSNQKNANWSNDVLEQNWPTLDEDFDDIFVIKVSLPFQSFVPLNYNQQNCPSLYLSDKPLENHSSTK